MEVTKKLYYEDSHQTEFEANVLSCEKSDDGYRIVLDQTAFFPEGGGQYGDVGQINDVLVLDTKEKDGIIYHYTEEPVATDSVVHGVIDWNVRFDRMQQHSGEHIVSGLIHQKFGYNNVGFHLGEDYCTMDFNGPISKEELKEIEKLANQAVFSDLEILILTPSKEELKEMEYRSKIEIEGQVRIVQIPGVDICACCAPHVNHTGEIGLIKLVDMMNYKGGERITMLSGTRALTDYDTKQENAKRIGALLCEKENQIADAVEKLKEEEKNLRGKLMELGRKMLLVKAEKIDISKEITVVFDEEITGNEPRELMNIILGRGAKVCAVFAGNDMEGYRYVIGSKKSDVRELSKALNAKFQGRGGGKPEMMQGSLKGTRKEIEAWEELK